MSIDCHFKLTFFLFLNVKVLMFFPFGTLFIFICFAKITINILTVVTKAILI